MPLRRSESTRTTLSMFLQRSTKYQKWLGIVNVLLLLGGIVLIFAGLWLKVIIHSFILAQPNWPESTPAPAPAPHVYLPFMLSFQLGYYMDQLDMVSSYFLILPWVLVGSGFLSFLIAAAGFIFSSTVEVCTVPYSTQSGTV